MNWRTSFLIQSTRCGAGSATACDLAPFVSVDSLPVVVILLIVVVVLLLAGALVGLAFQLLWLALTGLIIGALGRLVLPGRQEISLLATALVGIGASLLGGILANLFDVGWLVQFLVAVALAAIGIMLFTSSERAGRSRPA
jgi:uncharacterized membrane protein YeaQ/YmgE (transglycosylase-associated protein family)